MNDTSKRTGNAVRNISQVVGSLWFAGLLFLLLMIAMGSATVYETSYGTERTGVVFYHSWWFYSLLFLVGLNTLAAILARFPFTRKQLPFVVTHGGLILILVGAWVTQAWSETGRLAVREGETVRRFRLPGELIQLNGPNGKKAVFDLSQAIGNPFNRMDEPLPGAASLGPLRIEVKRYLPDMTWERQVVNDNKQPHLAYELVLRQEDGSEESTWAFGDSHGHRSNLGNRPVAVKLVEDPDRWQQLSTAAGDQSAGKVIVDYDGQTYSFNLEECREEPVQLGDTDIKLQVLRYMPHAVVGADKKIVNASDNPVNPAVEVQFTGPDLDNTRLAFAKFPDFRQQMGQKETSPIKLRFTSLASTPLSAPIELLVGPEGKLLVRFASIGADPTKHQVKMNEPVRTPWPDQEFFVRKRYDHARIQFQAMPAEPIRSNRKPAVLIRAIGPEMETEFWLERYGRQEIDVGKDVYTVQYDQRQKDLGFGVTLNYFRIGHYPGSQRPRSFESGITIDDPHSGRTQGRTISMNHPTSYGGFRFYQSSYQQSRQGMVSVFQVARDPGGPIVFTGYTAIMVGMLWILVQRLAAKRRRSAAASKTEAKQAGA